MPRLHDLKLFACGDEGARITLLGAVLDTVIGLVKLCAGAVAHSSALVADGIHSLSDAASDLVVVAAHNLSLREPTANFAYGYQRAETLGVLFIGLLLLVFAVGLAYQSGFALIGGGIAASPGPLTLCLALACLLLKECYYHISLAVGRRLDSQLLIANAHHSRTDVYTSLLVLAGLVAVEYGWHWLDPLMALGIALVVGKVAVGFLRNALAELMEANLPDEEREQVLRCIAGVAGVRGCHGLRGRRVGRGYVLECHLEVDAACSVSEGHQIGARASAAVLHQCTGISDLLVHVDPAGLRGGHGEPLPLPDRTAVMQRLQELCEGLALDIDTQRSGLHYADEGIRVELHCGGWPPHNVDQLTQLRQRLRDVVASTDWLMAVDIVYSPPTMQADTAKILYLHQHRQVAN
ncbi:cation diffusion facilitator family transporter [Parahaliea aestuarii]|uniref:Cation transporter n=1 Tax=Parahaliea aestuarii TaxID=1852021 RepID=A0A5C8ZSU6_9GAMM|nr:cation diffusion facilitator family transporter [Parahaliea aestuarii]TXS91583.1 cation transporter [Parahaliea aestuarii]